MSGNYPSMKKVVVRVLEIAGAGLTSALVAFALGRTETPPPAQTPAIVHLAPSDEEMIRSVRTDQAALLDQLRNGDARKAPTAATPATADAKPPVTTAQATPPAASAAPPATDVAVSATDLLPLTAPIKRVKSPTAPTATTQVPAPQVPAAQVPVPQAAAAQASTAPAPVVQAPAAQLAAPAATAPAAAAPVATPASVPATNPQVAVRREHKPERAQANEAKPENKTEAKPESKPRVAAKSELRAEELLQPRSAAQGAADPAARNASPREVVAAPTMQPAPAAQTPAPEPEYGLTAALKGFGSRLLPSRDRVPVPDGNAVRPPMPVGDLQQNAMSGGTRGGS